MKKLFILFFLCIPITLAFSEEKRFDVPVGDSPRLGPDSAVVTIIEFLDFQ